MGLAPSRCPVPGCANPYLAWHQVGPDEKVALCLGHADQAVREGVPADRLRALAHETDPGPPPPPWPQRKVLARVGGNFFYETPVILRLGLVTCIGFGRDRHGDLLLTARMPTASGQRRAAIVDNLWEERPTGANLVCPPSGRVVDITYPDGDHFRVAFLDVHDAAVLQARFRTVARWAYRLHYPVTMAEITLTVANTDLDFGPHHSGLGGPTTVDCFTSHDQVAIEIPLTPDQVHGLFPTGS